MFQLHTLVVLSVMCMILFDFMNCAERLLLGYDYSKSMEGFESSPVLSSSSFSS